MHFYHVFEGFLMVVGGFWPLPITSIEVLEGCHCILQMEKIAFPQNRLFLTPLHKNDYVSYVQTSPTVDQSNEEKQLSTIALHCSLCPT